MTNERHILVVDDDRDYAAMLATALRDAGYRVSVAWNQADAMRVLEGGDGPDLVVTDVMMGHLSEGFDLVRAIRLGRDSEGIPVVILSGVRELYDVYSQVGEEWLDCDAFFDKPVSPDDLVATVTTILEGSRGRPVGTDAGANEYDGSADVEEDDGGGPGPCVLVVEDERDHAALLAAYLREDGYRVRVATDGVDGLAKVLESPPDLITLDIQMPRKGGVEMYRELKSDPRFAEIPVVVVTGITRDDRDMEIFVRTFLETEHLPMPDAYLEKPVDGDELRRVAVNAIRTAEPDRHHISRTRSEDRSP